VARKQQQRRDSRSLQDVAHDEDAFTVPAVNEDTCDGAEENPRRKLGRRHARRGDRRTGLLVHEVRQRGVHHPVAGDGDEATNPQQGEVPPAEQREHLRACSDSELNAQQSQTVSSEHDIDRRAADPIDEPDNSGAPDIVRASSRVGKSGTRMLAEELTHAR
jgi:hypothetical protein